MGEAKARSEAETTAPSEGASARRSAWFPWLAWGWVVLLLLAVVAEATGNDDLRLALDFTRHLR